MIPALHEEHLSGLDGIVAGLRSAFAGTPPGSFAAEPDPALARALAWLELGLLGASPDPEDDAENDDTHADLAPAGDDRCPVLAELAATPPPAEVLDRLRSWVANTDEDPVADEGHLHELLLERYRPERRSGGGIYYTPRELIKATLRAALECGPASDGTPESLGEPLGFDALWDPSAGTGGFLVELVRQAAMNPDPESLRRFAGRLYGSDVDPGAVAVGTIRVRQALLEAGCPAAGRWAGLRQEDALEPEAGPPRDLASLLMVGNPPWANYGRARERAGKADPDWLTAALMRYRGEQSERKWQLSDEQIRFLALAEERLAGLRSGGLGFVLSRSLLEAPTRAGLRRSLLETFPRLDVLDLGGICR